MKTLLMLTPLIAPLIALIDLVDDETRLTIRKGGSTVGRVNDENEWRLAA